MADKNTSYPGHDEGTQKPTNTHGVNYMTPSANAPLSDTPTSVNVKNPSGAKGGEGGSK